ncbi:RYamide receptor [Megalopta genalis]|uniref:RYamide receptor n=1 Tax=Megalopta genalis TaxID=115081 RepID=UPI001442F57C|nr:orexin receptor type 2-like [Megalopta genalis]
MSVSLDNTTMMSTTTVEYNDTDNGADNSTDNGTIPLPDLYSILWYIYDNLHGKPNYLLIVLYVHVMVIAVTANVLVIAVVFKYHCMRSITNYFVVNLSVADLLVTTICMPMAVSQAISIDWTYGELMCKLSSYLQGVAVAASVFTITAMSIDRYLAIRSPIAFRRVFNRKSTVLVIVALWLVALIIFAPVLKVMTLQSPKLDLKLNTSLRGFWSVTSNSLQKPPVFYTCKEDFGLLGIRAHLFGTVCFVLVYAIPGVVVILSYSMMGRTLCSRKPPFDCDSVRGNASSQQTFRLVRERRRIAWILLLLAVLFALCWLPYNVLMLLIDLDAVGERNAIEYAHAYSLFLGHANSALNPVVYCIMTRTFRRSVVEILRCGSDGLVHRRSRRRSIQGTAVMDDVCAGCSAGDGSMRGLLRKRRMLAGCRCGLPIGGHHAVLALRRTATTSSGYDSFYSRHSTHKRCYMLRSLRERPQISTNQVANADKRRQTCNQRDDPKTSQLRISKLTTTNEQCL